MFTVRFPTGVSVAYNNAHYVVYYRDGKFGLYTEKDGDWIATIQAHAGAIVEASAACKVENPTTKGTLEDCAKALADNLRQLPDRYQYIDILRKLKRQLREFNITTGAWNEE